MHQSAAGQKAASVELACYKAAYRVVAHRHCLARWLLMSHDRAHSSRFFLTHQFLADMLGVRRSGVTVAAGLMQQQQVISYSRGMISILDRVALERLACECYQAGLDDYRRLLGKQDLTKAQMALRQDCAQGTP